MSIRRYLPSPQFSLIVVSFLLSAGLVFAADAFTHPAAPATVAVAPDTSDNASDNGNESNWEAALYAIQAQNASTSLTAPSADSVDQLLQAAQSTNLTDTVGKTLLINLSDAQSQGLGDDIPTQNQIIDAAAAQVASEASTTLSASQLNIVPTSSTTLHDYGNSVMQIIEAHPGASSSGTLLAIGFAIDNADPSQLQKLPAIGKEYQAIADALAQMPVPDTLAPLHIQVVNDFEEIAGAYPNMAETFTDPLRGIAGLQTYEEKTTEVARLFTNIAQNLSKDGILFTKDEPGNTWNVLLSP